MPASKLPSELLGKIFCLACSEPRTLPSLRSITADRNRNRWSLTAVCHQWRDVAIANPFLWSCIVIGVYEDANGAGVVTPSVKSLQETMRRSSTVPLTLIVERAHKDMFTFGLLTVMHELLRRCRHIELVPVANTHHTHLIRMPRNPYTARLSAIL